MRKLLVVAALAATCTAVPAYAATDAECQAMWTKADVNKDGTLSGPESTRYAAAMRVHDKQMTTNGNLDQASFMQNCRGDVYRMHKTDAGAPLKGSNSFT